MAYTRTLTRALVGMSVLVTALALVASCSGESEDAADNGGATGVAITWIEAESRSVESRHSALGSVQAQTDPSLAAEIAARVDRLAVDAGEAVAADDLLAELEAEDYRIERDRAEAETRRLRARIRLQEATVARSEALRASDYVSAQAFDEAQAELDALREELAAARHGLRAAERDLARTEVRAPLAGVIDERMVSEGDYVQAGTMLFRLATDEVLKVRAGFPETLAPVLQPGMRVEVRNRAAEQAELETEISAVRPTITTSGRMVEVIARIDNPGDWRAGASVNVDVVTDVRESVTVPTQALVRRPDGDTLYVLDDDRESVEARVVEAGRRTEDWIEIRDGIAAGEAIAVDGAGFLSDGATVAASSRGD